ncbi:MAG: 50S ribosomal protein L10 [bacterium]
MAKTKLQKQEIMRDLNAKIDKAKSMVFASFNALTVREIEELRNDLRKDNNEYYVAKKTLLNLALKEKGQEVDVDNFNGQIAVVFGYEDEVSPAKTLSKFMKSHVDKVEFVGGIMEGKFIEPAEVYELSKLPSKQELYAQLVGSLNAPVSGVVNVLAGNLRGLVQVLNAISEKKG